MRFIVFGAGAVGSTLGGLLALKDNDVLLICRKKHAQMIKKQKGLKLRSSTGEYFAHLQAEDDLRGKKIEEGTSLIITVKSYSTKSCLSELEEIVPGDIPIIAFQNGIGNEELIAETFENVYGGVCRMTCSLLHPGQVTFRKAGRVIIGRYPKGADSFAKKVSAVFEEAGLKSSVSRSIMCDKWLKLIANLLSAFNAIIDIRDHDTVEFMKLKVGLLEEAGKVLRADKIKAKSCDGKDFSLDEMIGDLKKPKAQKSSSYLKVHNSTWQNLYLKHKQIENGYFHGPIIELGKKYDIAVPFNKAAMERVTYCHKHELGPEALRAAEVLEEIEKG